METALHHLVVRVENALDQKEITLGVFLNIEGALDNISFESMCSGLTGYGVDRIIVRSIRATLECRMAMVALGGVPWSLAVSRGCHQGSI